MDYILDDEDGIVVRGKLNALIDNYNLEFDTESSNRTIYVETTGSDITGDGTIGSPFATIPKALSDVKTNIAANITILLGAGTFDLAGVDDLSRINELIFYDYNNLNICGTISVEKDLLSFTAASGDDSFKYDVLDDGGTPTFTPDEFDEMLVADNSDPLTWASSDAVPIFKNSATEIYFCEEWENPAKYDRVVSLATTVNLNSKRTLEHIDPRGQGRVKLRQISFVASDQQRPCRNEGSGVLYQIQYCRFECTTVNKQVLNISQTGWSVNLAQCVIVGNIAVVNDDQGMCRFLGVKLNNVYFKNAGTPTNGYWGGVLFEGGYFTLEAIVIRNVPFGIVFNGGRARISLEQSTRFYDVGCAVRFYLDGGTMNFPADPWWLQLDDCNYVFFSRYADRDVNCCLDGSRLYGTPNIAYRVPSDTAGTWKGLSLQNSNIDVNVSWFPERNIKIYMPDEYPTFQENKSAVLTNNATTNIVVGRKSKNDSIFIKYTVHRDDEVETNTIQISNNETAVVMAEGTLTGDDAGVSFAVAYDSDDIQLQVTLDNDVAGTFKYNVDRTMI